MAKQGFVNRSKDAAGTHVARSSPRSRGRGEASLSEIVQAINDGDDARWTELLERLAGQVRVSLLRFQVDNQLRNDAAAETWRTLFEKIGQIEDAEALPRWVGVVARNKMIDLIRRGSSAGPAVNLDNVVETLGTSDEDGLVAGETAIALGNAVARLSPREQAVLRGRVFTASPESLSRMGERLDMPTGSIGPTLGRSLQKLRRDRELMEFLSAEGQSNGQRAAA